MLNRNLSLASTALVAAALLAACSGGGGSTTTPPTGGPTATPSVAPVASPSAHASAAPSAAPSVAPSASPSAGSGSAIATGTVVDYAANTPLSGVKVSISAYTAGAAITQVATTTSTGTFSFTTAPGTYYLVIGSDSPTDTTTTLHTKIVLAAGANALTLPIPPAETDVTYTAAQMSGNFRLTALSGNQLSCFTGQNAGRTSASLTPEIPDELMTESMTAMAIENIGENSQNGAEPTPLYSTVFSFETSIGGVPMTDVSTAGYEASCPQLTQTYDFNSANEVYPYATSTANLYFGAAVMEQGSNDLNGLTAQTWAVDPR